MIESIKRDGTQVVLNIDTGLKVEKPVLMFRLECGKGYVAELLRKHLDTLMSDNNDELCKGVAKQPHLYLGPKELSELKSKLVHEWNGSKHCWK